MSLEPLPAWNPCALSLVPPKPSDAEFLAVFNRLAVALREAQDDTGLTQGIYFDALKDLPLPAVEAAADALMREPGRRFFPTTAEWRTAAEKAQLELLRRAVTSPAAEDERGVFICGDCHDTGWMMNRDGTPWWCDGGLRCGRRQAHAAHTFTAVCGCRAGNVNYQKTKHFGAGR